MRKIRKLKKEQRKRRREEERKRGRDEGRKRGREEDRKGVRNEAMVNVGARMDLCMCTCVRTLSIQYSSTNKTFISDVYN